MSWVFISVQMVTALPEFLSLGLALGLLGGVTRYLVLEPVMGHSRAGAHTLREVCP